MAWPSTVTEPLLLTDSGLKGSKRCLPSGLSDQLSCLESALDSGEAAQDGAHRSVAAAVRHIPNRKRFMRGPRGKRQGHHSSSAGEFVPVEAQRGKCAGSSGQQVYTDIRESEVG